jgi:hypothetical protein
VTLMALSSGTAWITSVSPGTRLSTALAVFIVSPLTTAPGDDHMYRKPCRASRKRARHGDRPDLTYSISQLRALPDSAFKERRSIVSSRCCLCC